jgi:hypothetical protein
VLKEALLGVNVIDVAADDVVAKDAETPVNSLICVELDSIPEGTLVIPVYEICPELDTNSGLLATLLYST